MASLEHSCYRFGDESIRCPKCSGSTVKNGKILGKQQYKCKECNKRFQLDYTYKACEPNTSPNIVALIKEGCDSLNSKAFKHFGKHCFSAYSKNCGKN